MAGLTPQHGATGRHAMCAVVEVVVVRLVGGRWEQGRCVFAPRIDEGAINSARTPQTVL